MLYDPTATDSIFADGRPPSEDVQGLLDWARERLGMNGTRPWRLLSARRKMGKVLFEIEEAAPTGTRRLIGKRGKSERAEVLDRALRELWSAGFRPPARYTVTESVACIPERGFILQEKAPGVQAFDLILQDPAEATRAAGECAAWLAALHRCPVRATPGLNDPKAVVTWVKDLSALLPDQAARIGRIEDAILRELADPVGETVPCHGDFHAMNIFVEGAERVTGIDLDKFSQREAESDVGYFLCQTASFGYFKSGAFANTAEARRVFLERYREHTGREVRVRRAGLYMAMAFLKNLHFELVLLKTGRNQYIAPWLNSAARAILEEDLHLSQ